MNDLVIVESPTKARTLSKFLGNKYRVEASFGHVRDLPKSDIGVDTQNNFEPRYIVPRDKTKRVKQLKKDLESAKTLWLATDPDREGEAIAWHIAELLHSSGGKQKPKQLKSPKSPQIHRVVFHEITEGAIKEAFLHPKDIDLKLVDAQQARRILDRLVGYKLSPLLWKKVKAGLSAGRVQSVALRLIVEREEEVVKFNPVEYWVVEADLDTAPGPAGLYPRSMSSVDKLPAGTQRGTPAPVTPRESNSFIATLIELNGKKLSIKNKTEADEHLEKLKTFDYSVSKVTKKEVKRYSPPPFTTSTLQQTASHALGMTAKKTMMLAQQLYEQGYITYMRTDSVNLAVSAVEATRKYIASSLGSKYLPQSPRVFKTKSKVAQEAHEAIRPTNVQVTGNSLQSTGGFSGDHSKLYDLIWKRMVASQVSEAVMDQTSVDVIARSEATKQSMDRHADARDDGNTYTLRATGSVIKFDGWMKIYGKQQATTDGEQEGESEKEDKEKILPELKEGEDLNLVQLLPSQHFTEPPPRFNEASLIKKLEELGIGRPSTYASIVSTIQERFYVERVERKFIPTELGVAVTKFLKDNFKNIVDYSFTAQMEAELDEIAEGKRQWRPTISEFYTPFAKRIEETDLGAERVKIEVEETDEKCPTCGKNLVVKFGRFGKFLACSGFPDCKFTKQYEEIVEGVKCPKDGGNIIVKRTKKGRPFFGCSNYPKCDFASWNKPGAEKSISLDSETS